MGCLGLDARVRCRLNTDAVAGVLYGASLVRRTIPAHRASARGRRPGAHCAAVRRASHASSATCGSARCTPLGSSQAVVSPVSAHPSARPAHADRTHPPSHPARNFEFQRQAAPGVWRHTHFAIAVSSPCLRRVAASMMTRLQIDQYILMYACAKKTRCARTCSEAAAPARVTPHGERVDERTRVWLRRRLLPLIAQHQK
jgi:hypothetical protein